MSQPTCARWSSLWSASTSAIIASTTGVPRMPTQGSWRPLVAISVASPSLVIGRLRDQDRAGRLERHAADHRLAGRNAARDPARMVGVELRRAILAGPHRIGILLAAQPRRGEAVADLDALDRVDAHHRGGQIGVELGIDRRAPACRDAGGDAFHHRAERRSGLARLVDQPSQRLAAAASGQKNGLLPISAASNAARSIASPPISLT